MTLPTAIFVPHAGVRDPQEPATYSRPTRVQIIRDGNEGAVEIYDLQDEVAEFVTPDITRDSQEKVQRRWQHEPEK